MSDTPDVQQAEFKARKARQREEESLHGLATQIEELTKGHPATAEAWDIVHQAADHLRLLGAFREGRPEPFAEIIARELTLEDKLVLLIEECAEVAKAATKCLRFGYRANHGTGYGQNDVVLAGEIGDVLGVIDSLPLDRTIVEGTRAVKIEKAERAKAQFHKEPDNV